MVFAAHQADMMIDMLKDSTAVVSLNMLFIKSKKFLSRITLALSIMIAEERKLLFLMRNLVISYFMEVTLRNVTSMLLSMLEMARWLKRNNTVFLSVPILYAVVTHLMLSASRLIF